MLTSFSPPSGDEIFSKSLSSHCNAYQGPSKRNSSMAQNELTSFRRLASDWKKVRLAVREIQCRWKADTCDHRTVENRTTPARSKAL